MSIFMDGELLSSFLAGRASDALTAAENLDARRIEGGDLNELVGEIWERIGVEPLSFSWAKKSSGRVSEKPTAIHSSEGPPVRRMVASLELFVPYAGTRELWSKVIDGVVPMGQYPLGGVRVLDDEQLLIVFYVGDKEDREIVDDIARVEQHLNTYVGWCNERVQVWTTTVRGELHDRLERRRRIVQRGSALDDALGIPIHKRPANEQIPVPLKRMSLKVPAVSVSNGGQPDHVLEEEIYEDVVRTIDRLAVAMERTSTAFGLNEPAIRDLILVVLNANYDGQAVGEAFNADGKTDILLRWQGRVAFIGECKFWAGPQSLTDAVDQLLSYITWRDTKAALVVFIKDRKDVGAIIKSAKTTMESHPKCEGVDPARTEWDSCTRYILRKPDDDDRKISVALILVRLYAGK
ncbi:hypothetical protein [Rhodococcus sp. 14-2470-1a]|uniref:hypothetical protein n=1 Tax=Rhodococcus sp. 14-2470-1a TaxID=2023150 RepID=UPI00117A47CE|nr:hypothetical protein [Rhodococcus sp. 14-2470-1a]